MVLKKRNWVSKTFGFEKILWSEILAEINVGLNNFGLRTFLSTQIINPKKLGSKSLVKIGTVTAEIWLIRTNVARHMLPGQM